MRREDAGAFYGRSADDLSDLVKASLRKTHIKGVESFDVISQRVRSQVFINAREFRSRFARGYAILLSELRETDG